MIKIHTSNTTIELAEVRYTRCSLIDYNGNEYIVLDYFNKKSLYKLRENDEGRIEFIYVDDILQIEAEKERTVDLRGF